jgi:hypothetical protein
MPAAGAVVRWMARIILESGDNCLEISKQSPEIAQLFQSDKAIGKARFDPKWTDREARPRR